MAFDGYSILMKINKEEKRTPNVLYHGTARQFLETREIAYYLKGDNVYHKIGDC